MTFRLLVIEDDAVGAEASVCSLLAHDPAYRCQPVRWEDLTLPSLRRAEAHAVVAVAVPQTPRTISVFESLVEHPIMLPTLAVLPDEVSEPLLRMASGVSDDFIFAPIRCDELRHRLSRVLGTPRDDVDAVREHLLREMALTQLVGGDTAFVQAVEHVPRFARSDMPVLITGETGTGKELCARAIHVLSKRRDHPFIAVDCGALPDHLVENELFGHTRGAYTDAHRDQRGLAAMAEGGTLFLDEIDALSLTAQGKLLRFLQDRSFRPLGADRFQQSDVNIIAATNLDLEVAVADRRFRTDLFYRLNVLRLHLPPLRERRADIARLASHFLQQYRTTAAIGARSFSVAALRQLERHDWPGNVRELFNIVQRAVVSCDGAQILPCHIALAAPPPPQNAVPASFRTARAAAVEAFERLYVEELLRKHCGNVTRAARDAKKDRRAFGRLVKKHQIDWRASERDGTSRTQPRGARVPLPVRARID